MADFYLKDMDTREFKVVRWRCCYPGCTRYTRLRDYGVAPMYFWPVSKGGWIRIGFRYGDGFFCGTHWRATKKATAFEWPEGFNPESYIEAPTE